MNTCARCGMSLMPTATVCTGCGLPLGAPVATAPTVQAAPPAQQAAPLDQPAPPAPTPPVGYATVGYGTAAGSGPAPSPGRNTTLLIAAVVAIVGAFAAYLITRHHSGTPSLESFTAGSGTPTSSQIANVQTNLRVLAIAEESYLTDYGQFSPFLSQLTADGFQQVPGSEDQTLSIAVAPDGKSGFCLLGSTSNDIVLARFYLYDSEDGGLQPDSYPNSFAAERACTIPSITGNDFV